MRDECYLCNNTAGHLVTVRWMVECMVREWVLVLDLSARSDLNISSERHKPSLPHFPLSRVFSVYKTPNNTINTVIQP